MGNTSASPAATVTPDRVKMALLELEKLAQDVLEKPGVPGLAIAVVYQDQVVYAKGFGVREAGKSDLVDADTVFQLASVSKPLGSTVIAGLVHDRVAKWDDRIIDHDPGFQMHDSSVTAALTIRDTYSHRSGLPEHAGDLLEEMGYDRAEVLRRLRFIPIKDKFRSHYAYTNFGMTEGAIAAAKATGKSWEEISEERLYKRLGMSSTSSRLSEFLARTNRARGHVRVNGQWVAKYQRKPDAQSPAGGASSSVNDMARWIRLHLNGGTFDGKPIISAEALAETYRPHMVREPEIKPAAERYGFYGLGWNVDYDELGHVKLSHSGAFLLGAATTVCLLPAEGLGIVVLTNAQPLGMAEVPAQSFLDLATYGKVQQDWPALYLSYYEAEMKKQGHSPIDYAKTPAVARGGIGKRGVCRNVRERFLRGARDRRAGWRAHNAPWARATGLSTDPLRPRYVFLRHWARDGGRLARRHVSHRWGRQSGRVVVENLDKEGLGAFTRAQGK
jgi:CubicO group peptidase (beta-lactamase class C family)